MTMVDPDGKRQIAKKNGDMTYTTGLPCKHGHVGPRYTSNAICVECKRATFEKRYAANRAVILAEGQAWKDANRDRVNAYARQYREKFPEQTKRSTAKYKAMHRAVYTSNERKRQAKKLQAMPKWLTQSQHDAIDAIYQMSKRLQSQSGKKMAVDHIVPLQGKNVCGLHVPWNLRVISCSENSVKRAKLTDDAYLPKITSVMIGWSGLPWNWS